MENSLIAAGITLIIAAIIGGGVEAFSVKIPKIQKMPIRVLLIVLGIMMIVGSILYAIPIKRNQDTISEKILHRKYVVGWSGDVVGDSESDKIEYHIIEQKIRYDNNTIGITYTGSKNVPGFMIFNIQNKKIVGYWKDGDNSSSPLPGRIELEFNDDVTFAKGWWSYDPRNESFDKKYTKYHAYMKAIP